MSIQHLIKLIDQRDKLTRRIDDLTEQTFRPGSAVHWTIGKYLQGGTVIMASRDRLNVRNSITGKESWIYVYRVLDAERVI